MAEHIPDFLALDEIPPVSSSRLPGIMHLHHQPIQFPDEFRGLAAFALEVPVLNSFPDVFLCHHLPGIM